MPDEPASGAAEPIRQIGTAPEEDEVDLEAEFGGADDEPEEVALDSVVDELRQEVETDEVRLPIRGRPGYEVTYKPERDGEKIQKWRRQARDRKQIDGVDELKFACLVLAHTMTGLIRRGEPILDAGRGLTVRSKALLDILEVGGTRAALRKLYGLDGNLLQVAREVLAAGGYSDEGLEVEDELEDPTGGS